MLLAEGDVRTFPDSSTDVPYVSFGGDGGINASDVLYFLHHSLGVAVSVQTIILT